MVVNGKASNIVQNIFYVYDVTDFTRLRHSIPVAAKCKCISNPLLRPGIDSTHAQV
jgi:hypothetical protein